MFKSLALTAIAAFTATAGCSKSPSDNDADPLTPGVRIEAGANTSDTIDAKLLQALVVRVATPDGKAAVGVPVLFNSLGNVLLASASDASAIFEGATNATTDANGRAAVRIALGGVAGTARVAIVVPLYGFTDTASYTVRAGAATKVRLAAGDTVVEAGDPLTIVGSAADRRNNPTTEAVQLSATGSITVSGSGVVNTSTAGVGWVIASANMSGIQQRDSAKIFVVPATRIAVSALHGPIRLSTLLGRNERVVITGNVNAQDWAPAGNRLVYVDDRGNDEYALSVTDTLGSTVRLPVPLRSTWPQYSRDGNWIYFFTQNDQPPVVYRIHPDGTGIEILVQGSFPTPSPDGTRVAFMANGSLNILNLAARASVAVPNTSAGFATRWSPDGQWIAYRAAGGMVVIRPDGSARRFLFGPSTGGIAWSGDSRWILGGNFDGGTLQLIDMTTEMSTMLPVRGVYPAWR